MRLPDGPLDVVAVGHAVVDRIALVEDSVLAANGLFKGTMRLVEDPAAFLAGGPGEQVAELAAGSAGNTAAGLVLLGSSVAFVGRVGDDDLGRAYAADMVRLHVEVHLGAPVQDQSSGCCEVLVTPDSERTMSTYLGASTALSGADLPDSLLARARVLYVEGYLWDSPRAVAAVHAALERRSLSRDAAPGRAAPVLALSLSDPLCVERHRQAFVDLVGSEVGLLFANEAEIEVLTGLGLDGALEVAARWPGVSAITRGAKGSVVVRGGESFEEPAVPVANVVDTTGAGDLYAAGFLHGFASGASLRRCAALGSLVASEVVGHVGARPVASLRSLADAAGWPPRPRPQGDPT